MYEIGQVFRMTPNFRFITTKKSFEIRNETNRCTQVTGCILLVCHYWPSSKATRKSCFIFSKNNTLHRSLNFFFYLFFSPSVMTTCFPNYLFSYGINFIRTVNNENSSDILEKQEQLYFEWKRRGKKSLLLSDCKTNDFSFILFGLFCLPKTSAASNLCSSSQKYEL